VNAPTVEISGITAAMAIAVVVLFGFALRGRSWTWWLLGYALTLATLALAWRRR
jgi:hypothetical protein